MKSVMICLAKEDNVASKTIRFITGSEFSHVFLEFYSDEWGSMQAIEIDDRGIIQVPARTLPYLSRNVERYYANPGFKDVIVRRNELVGHRYDWKGLFGGLWKMIMLRLFGERFTKPWHSKGRFFCTEYLATLIADNDPLNYTLEPWMSSPEDITKYARKFLTKADV